MSERDETETDSWEDNFREAILKFSASSGRKARLLTERDDIIRAMESKRLLLQYGNNLFLRIHGRASIDAEKEIWFRAICLAMTGAFIAGKFEGSGEERASETEFVAGILKTERKTGPYPSKRESIPYKMLEDLRNGMDLASMKQETLAERYGASRGTAVAARQAALSMLAAENSNKTPPDSDKA